MTIARLGGGLGRDFWRLWSASVVSNLADGMFWVALPLLAVSLTDSPALVAGVTVAARLPWLVFALVAGALADRLDRRRTMMLVDFGRVVLLGGLAVAVIAGAATVWLIYVVAFLLGVLETLFDTAAQAILPNVVPRERLTAANGRLLAAEFTMNQFVGPPLGGLLAATGLGVAFGTTAAGYLAAALLIAGLAGSFRPGRAGPPTRIDQEIREGIGYLARHRLLRVLAVVIALLNLAQGAVWAILVLYVVAPGPMGLSEVGYGLLLTTNAVGTIAGTIVAGPIEQRLGKPNLFAVCVVVLAAGNVALASSTSPFVVGGVFAIGGIFLGAFNVAYQSLRQRIVPDRILGRLVATFRMLGWGALPLGAIVGGVVGEAFGLTAVFWAAAVMTIVLLPARLLVSDERIAQAEAVAVAERGRASEALAAT
ncbi:MAG TPA: MFS transporter [Candidatus Limnocylindrales bacterium]|nr:MFS transporter [Candidatus Limnocylindrales bacterium]